MIERAAAECSISVTEKTSEESDFGLSQASMSKMLLVKRSELTNIK